MKHDEASKPVIPASQRVNVSPIEEEAKDGILEDKKKIFENLFYTDPVFADLAVDYAKCGNEKQQAATCLAMSIFVGNPGYTGLAYIIHHIFGMVYGFGTNSEPELFMKTLEDLISAAYKDEDMMQYLTGIKDELPTHN